jgi:hypothetical protein
MPYEASHFDSDIMTCGRMTFSRALKLAKREYPDRSTGDQRKIAKGIQIISTKVRKFKRLV